MTKRWGVLGAVVVAAACGGGTGDGGIGPSEDYSLALARSTLAIAQGAQDTVTVTVNRDNFTGAVTLRLDGAPSGVTGSFDPPAPTGNTSRLTITVASSVHAGPYPLTVNGTGSPGNRSAPLALTVSAVAGSPVNAPSSVVAVGASTTTIQLSWHDNSTNETGFNVERASGSGAFTQVATLNANATSYEDAGLTVEQSYRFRVRAFADNSTSPYSNTLTASTCLAGETSPAYRPYRELMALVSCTGPLYVSGSSAVPLNALRDAGSMLEAMLLHRPDVGSALKTGGAVTGVFARTETVCDVVYFSAYQGTDLCARGAGGLGGTAALPATACSEKNVLKQADDPYQRGTPGGENICVHELSHTVMNVGLSASDRVQIQQRYDAARTEGLWTGDYAMENAEEFFAEMSQTYFCANPETPNALHHGINCADELRNYDFKTFQLIDGIYRGSSDLR